MTLQQALDTFELFTLDGQNASSLKKIYYRLAQVYHPDKGGSFEQFILLQESYLHLKQNLFKKPNFDDVVFEDQSNSDFNTDQDFKDLQVKHNELKNFYKDLIKVVEIYENIFNTQIGIINQSNDSIKTLFVTHENLKNNLQNQFAKNLDQIKKSYEKTWWEYLLPVRKLTQDQYIQASNSLITNFNQTIKDLDEELVSQMLKLYRGSFQDLIDLLSDI